MDVTINPIQHRSSINMKKTNCDRYSREIEDKQSKRRLPTNCQKGEKILHDIILKAASHYAEDITLWASGVKIPEVEHKINGYLIEMSCFLRANSVLISAPNSTVTLFTSDPMQANTQPKIKISDAELDSDK